MTNAKALVRHHANHITILCPDGHYIETFDLRRQMYGGSMFQADVSDHQEGRPHCRFNRMASVCVSKHHMYAPIASSGA